MAFYEALQNSDHAHSGDYSNGNIVLIKDGFCWPALFFTPFWLVFRGMWLILVMYIGVTLLFSALAEFNIIAPQIVFWLNIGVSILFAWEANFLRKWTLQRANYRHIGVSLGANIQEAEVNFFSQFMGGGNVEKTNIQPVNKVETTNVSTSIINPINDKNPTDNKKSHWKIGGKRQSDSVIGMYSDE
ncbi:MAG: DUF2628 domain-containing protein [Rhizobiales bacterium]|nr:DUF2628 domain-containing protein [Hyphomicrobiales bacterium]